MFGVHSHEIICRAFQKTEFALNALKDSGADSFSIRMADIYLDNFSRLMELKQVAKAIKNLRRAQLLMIWYWCGEVKTTTAFVLTPKMLFDPV